jgi:hypothetical protein
LVYVRTIRGSQAEERRSAVSLRIFPRAGRAFSDPGR